MSYKTSEQVFYCISLFKCTDCGCPLLSKVKSKLNGGSWWNMTYGGGRAKSSKSYRSTMLTNLKSAIYLAFDDQGSRCN